RARSARTTPPPARRRAAPANASRPSRRPAPDAPPRSSPCRSQAALRRAANPRRMSRARSSLLHHEFDAAVLRLAIFTLVAGERLRAAVADRRETVGRKSGAHEVIDHGLRAALRQGLVGGLLTVAVGMAGDFDRR